MLIFKAPESPQTAARPWCAIYSRLAGCQDFNDAQPGCQGPTRRLIGSERVWDRGATLTLRLRSFETETLAEKENLAALAEEEDDVVQVTIKEISATSCSWRRVI